MSEIKNKLKIGRQTKWPARPGSEYIDNQDPSKWWKKPSLVVAFFFGVITTVLLSNIKPFFPNALGGGLAVFFVNYIGLNWYLDRYDYFMTLHRKLVKREGLSTNWYKNGKKSAEENHKYGKLMSVMVWKPNGENILNLHPIRTIVAREMIVPEVTRFDILTELINRVRAVVLSGKVDINLHLQSLEDWALGSQRMR